MGELYFLFFLSFFFFFFFLLGLQIVTMTNWRGRVFCDAGTGVYVMFGRASGSERISMPVCSGRA
jgi:hypothetical protein